MSENARPAVELIKEAYTRCFLSGRSTARVKDSVLAGRFFPQSDESTNGVAGRSIAWKLFLVSDEPLESDTAEAKPPIVSLRRLRQTYKDLILKNMRAPDGTYEEGLLVPGPTELSERPADSAANLEKNNPLSLHDENPWTEWFAAVELRKTILQDVERTFPDIGYFRDPEVQYQLTLILFLFATTHPGIGYRQGMHELLAPLYYAVDFDSISDRAALDDRAISEFCSRPWVSADAWGLFSAVMHGASKWYEWREWSDETTSPTATVASPLANHVHLSIPDGSMGIKPYIAPIVEACERMQSSHLKSVDPLLWKQMQSAGIEPQIYGIRWLRLLFTREFSMEDSMVLWDGLFACDPSLYLAPWICVAMLLRIRNRLIPSDYSGQLTYLLHYPTIPSAPDIEDAPHQATLLIRQALALQMAPTPSAGAAIVVENRNLLKIPIEVPDPPASPASKRRPRAQRGHGAAGSDAFTGVAAQGRGVPTQSHGRYPSSPQMGLPEMLARGLLDRGESLGINKTVMNAVTELKRNLPDLSGSLARTPPATSSATQYAAFPLLDERPPEERPPWEARTRFEMEKDVADTKARNKLLGESVGWIVDTLLQDEGDQDVDTERAKKVKSKKREALESLVYVRDVLLSGDLALRDLDQERLLGEEEFRKRREKAQQQTHGASGSSPSSRTVELPRPSASFAGPVGSTKQQPSASKSSHPSFVAHSSQFPSVGPRSPPTTHLGTVTHRPAASPSPHPTSPAVLTPNTSVNATALAPWSHTRSSFAQGSANSPAFTAALPRVPPRSSSTLRVSPSSQVKVPASSSDYFQGSAAPKPELRNAAQSGQVQHDPLGALP